MRQDGPHEFARETDIDGVAQDFDARFFSEETRLYRRQHGEATQADGQARQEQG